jgi:hypothetical protein
MIKLNKPTNLNGTELRQQLNTAGVTISNEPSAVKADNEGNLWLDIATKDEAKAKSVVEAHNGTIIAPEPTVADKLANAGLTVEDLRAALGL